MWITLASGAMSGASFGTLAFLTLLCSWKYSTKKKLSLASRLHYHSPTALIFGFLVGGIAGSLLALIIAPEVLKVLLGQLWFRILLDTSVGTTLGIFSVAFFRVHYTFIITSEYVAPTLLEVWLFESRNLLFLGGVLGVIGGMIAASESGCLLL
ncbi:MAG: hypothetical protein QNJ46_24130 [Leptolyngbyaceae cyanobacterium MO_188.B28]|nr:hypothetical protein [Leptolyngbyaceae cyanobacterium MO_188.B28]